MKENNEIEIMFAKQEIEINGETIVVKPYSWAMGIQAVQPISVLVKLFMNHIEEVQTAYKGYEELKLNMAKAQEEQDEETEVSIPFKEIIALADPILGAIKVEELEMLTTALTKLMLFSVDKPRQYIETLMPDDAVTLATAVYEANKYFFTKRLAKTNQPGEKITK